MRNRLIIAIPLLLCALYIVLQIQRSDFSQDYAAARAWWLGLNPSDRTVDLLRACCPEVRSTFPSIIQTAHPPLATTIMLPFALLPWASARILWLLMSWGLIVWI